MIDFKTAPKRDLSNKMIAGVCSGVAKNADVDPFWVRLIAVLLLPISFGFIGLVYVGLAITMPAES